jgi:hypothetical protein
LHRIASTAPIDEAPTLRAAATEITTTCYSNAIIPVRPTYGGHELNKAYGPPSCARKLPDMQITPRLLVIAGIALLAALHQAQSCKFHPPSATQEPGPISLPPIACGERGLHLEQQGT